MEVILSSMEEILRYNLVDPNILQKMVEKLITYIHKYFQFNEIDFKVDSKILKICELIYLNQNIFIHNDNLKSISSFSMLRSQDVGSQNTDCLKYKTPNRALRRIYNNKTY